MEIRIKVNRTLSTISRSSWTNSTRITAPYGVIEIIQLLRIRTIDCLYGVPTATASKIKAWAIHLRGKKKVHERLYNLKLHNVLRVTKWEYQWTCRLLCWISSCRCHTANGIHLAPHDKNMDDLGKKILKKISIDYQILQKGFEARSWTKGVITRVNWALACAFLKVYTPSIWPY